jgi:hypothetical protein
MDSTKSHVKIYNIAAQAAEDFEFDYTTDHYDLLGELVPDKDNWGDLIWGIGLEEYEYSPQQETIHFTLTTKWDAPVAWLQNASIGSHYFENKLITMATVQQDETCVTGVAVMDGEILQNKNIWSMESTEVEKYYNDDENDYDLDSLDNQIWDSIGKFVNVCEQFYLEREEKND